MQRHDEQVPKDLAVTTHELRWDCSACDREPAALGLRAPAVRGRRDVVVGLVVAELVILVLTLKLAIPLGDGQIQISIGVHLLFIALLAVMGLVRLSELQTLLYLASCGAAFLLHSVITNHGYSVPSLLSFAIIYATTCFSIPIDREQYRRILLAFQVIAACACVGVWVDWIVQLLGYPIPDLEPLIPKAIRLTYYAYKQPVVWGSPWTKPNGLLFPETSFISAFLGIAMTIEMGYFQRPFFLVLLSTSLFATLGGSGMLLVALTAPFLASRLSWGGIVGLSIAALVTVLVGTQLGALDSIAQRSTELTNHDTSGYHRFVDPLLLLGDSLLRDPADALFGSGAGNAAKGLNIIWSPMAKAVNEYGLLFGIVFLLMTVAFMFGSGRPFVVSWACFVNYHLLGGGFVVPWYAVLALVLVGGYVISPVDVQKAASRSGPIRRWTRLSIGTF